MTRTGLDSVRPLVQELAVCVAVISAGVGDPLLANSSPPLGLALRGLEHRS